ncbi:MAG: ABC transporter substrate-binding protein [Actinobacteria bacterium]|nr:ABC transporter substrate-binding protein [Actinomycetota bacterium]
MKRTRVILVLLTIVALLWALGCAGKPGEDESSLPEASAEPYRIGVVISLSGTYAGLGGPEQKAIDMEVARINAEGGVNGHPIEIVYEDDATDAAKAQAAVVRLIDEVGVIAVLGASGTGQTMAMRADIERAGVPQISMAGGSAVTAQLSEWVFQTPWPNRIVVPFVLKAMAADGYKNIAVISDTGGYGVDGHDVIVKSAADAGVTIVADETYNPGDADMTAQLTKMRGANPDAVLVWAAGKEAATIAKNARQLNMTQPIYGGSGIARLEFISGAGEAAEGVKLGTGKILVPEAYGEGTEEYEVATSFIDRYTEEYGEAPDIFAGHAYDAFGLVVDALGRVEGEATPAALRDAIEATDGWIGVGGTFSYSAEDHNGLTEDDLVMYVIEGGTWKLAE